MNKQLLYSGILLLFILGGGTALLSIQKKSKVDLNTQNPQIKITEDKDTNTQPASVPSPSNELVNNNELGTIKGNLCYPSEMLPSGKIIAKDINTNKTFEVDYLGAPPAKSSEYLINVPAGTYNLKYQVPTDNNNFLSGYHTQCGPSNEFKCSDPLTHELISVNVKSKQITGNIDICDFYYPRDKEPNF